MDLLEERAELTAAGLPTFEEDEIETLRQDEVHVYKCVQRSSWRGIVDTDKARMFSPMCRLRMPHGRSEDHSNKSAAGVALMTTCRILWISGGAAGAVRLEHVVRAAADVFIPILPSARATLHLAVGAVVVQPQ